MQGEEREDLQPCGACGRGTLRPKDMAWVRTGHRDDPRLCVRRRIVLPVCDACGDMALDHVLAAALDEALEDAYRQKRLRQQRAMISDLHKLGLTSTEIECAACLPPGHVTRLRRGMVASPRTFRLLHLLHAFSPGAVWALSRIDPALAEVYARVATDDEL
jgi:hypothetical protein